MKRYETVIIFQPRLSEAELKTEIGKVEQFLQSNGGGNLAADSWGRKEMAYDLNKERAGHYIFLSYETELSDLIEKLNASLRISEHVVKFQTHRLSDRTRKFKGRRSSASGDDDSTVDVGGY